MAATRTSEPVQAGGLRRLLEGGGQFDFVGRTRLWAIVSAVLLLAALAGLVLRGVNLSIDFTGGTGYIVSGASVAFDSEDLRDALVDLVGTDVAAQVSSDAEGTGALVTTPPVGEIGGAEQAEVIDRLAQVTGVEAADIDVSAVGPRWGEAVTGQALRALLAFLALVVTYITLRFDLRMALAAMGSLAHDLVVTVGIYSLVGFEISPASVIAFLTILGYSLYDTVVVFDRINEDVTAEGATSTAPFARIANRALNTVLVRSLSTTITSVLPVASLLFIGGGLLGAGTLNDLALALAIGMLVGAYSSLFVATPVLVLLEDRHRRRQATRPSAPGRPASSGP